jgi:hypothetical protein
MTRQQERPASHDGGDAAGDDHGVYQRIVVGSVVEKPGKGKRRRPGSGLRRP